MTDSQDLQTAQKILKNVHGQTLSVEERRERAVELAALILKEARRIQTTEERRIQSQIDRMMDDPKGKVFTLRMTDECFRSHKSQRVANQMLYLLDTYGVPQFLSYSRKLQMYGFKSIAKVAPKMIVPIAQRMLRKDTSTVIIPGERRPLMRHVKRRWREGIRVNINHLGEAILGEEEAKKRLQIYLEDLSRPEIEYISVKVSTIGSQINLLAWEETINVLEPRLKELYREAKAHSYKRPNGKVVPKFVNLDMEEYRDLHLTVELFRRVLDDPEFFQHSAGIVLQAYLPDAYLIQQQLTVWAMQRVANGGAPIKIRLVKGANLAMEKVDASIHGWPQAPYLNKADVDANFKRMLHYGCQPDHAHAAMLGIGSHNLFDIAYALLLRSELGVDKGVEFEMLEGMADHTRKVVQKLSGGMLLYCPAAKASEFQNAVAYLVRRLDENTDPENFLHHLFGLYPETQEWHDQVNHFSLACHAANAVGLKPRRHQNRLLEVEECDETKPFMNEPDTDWALTQNRKWIQGHLQNWKEQVIDPIPLVIAGKEIHTKGSIGSGRDPSCPSVNFYHFSLADRSLVEKAIGAAEKAQKWWGVTTVEERSHYLAKIAHQLRVKRADLIGAMVMDGGKTIAEADVEVSEAIDFAEYYRQSLKELSKLEDISWQSRGPVLVTPPWNFPCAIPLGGIVVALAAGNTVLFKPARETTYIGWVLAEACWEAGIGRDVLQFVIPEDREARSLLVEDPRVSTVILTGSTETAKAMYRSRPGIHLIAETGGKDAMIVTSLADRDLAARDIVQSAFGHAGQKCSACSLLILEAEVYEDPNFRRTLRDAAQSLPVGSAWDCYTRVNPLVQEPGEDLLKALTTLEDGQEWLLKPEQDPNNPQLWSPGIKLGVKEGSYHHVTEFFGPVLSVMRADDLEHAIKLANGTPYGLTSGIHTLDEREQSRWVKGIEAGNLYINKGITGAIVRRQPFGGCKESSFGPGAKAGGPNYITQLMRASQLSLPKEKEPLDSSLNVLTLELEKMEVTEEQLSLWEASLGSYAYYWKHYFSQDHDPSHLVGEDNIFRYLPRKDLVLRVNHEDDLFDVMRCIAAAFITRAALQVSGDSEHLRHISRVDWANIAKNVEIKGESEVQFIDRVQSGALRRVRFLSQPSESLKVACAEAACHAEVSPVLACGRIELLQNLREVSISYAYHRYGNLGERES